MRILYGVQGTGNGHLSRARAMAAALGRRRVQVDWLFSGRAREQFFDMDCFGDYAVRRGLTFVNRDGRVHYWRTFFGNNYLQFLRDVSALRLDDYDFVITDFEPICAWAGRLRGKPVISMGHQPAFDHPVPIAGHNLRSELVMRFFAPGTMRVGMHWDRFAAPILPPLIDTGTGEVKSRDRKILVYLPFERQSAVHELLAGLSPFEFYIYAPGTRPAQRGNLHLRPTSLGGFQRDLHDCSAVLCNAGFELASECLALGKRLLVKPQGGQMEQASNALALETLGYGQVLRALDREQVRAWLAAEYPVPKIDFPDVAEALAGWLQRGDFCDESLNSLSEQLWRRVRVCFSAASHATAR